MSISNAIVHQFFRTTDADILTLRADELDVDEALHDLLGQVKTAFYNRSNKQYGRFSDEAGHVKALAGQWLKGGIGFVTLSEQWMKHLQTELAARELDIEGYWLFAQETLEQGNQLWFFHFKHKPGLYLSQQLDLGNSAMIDFGRLGFGGVIDLAALARKDAQYLTVSFGFGDRALQVTLLDVVNFVDTLDTSVDTDRFMAIVKAYSETLPTDKGANYRRKAIEYCTEQDKLGETVVCNEVSVALEGAQDPARSESLVTFMQQTEPEAKAEFIPDRKSLKKYLRYTGKSKEVSISFSNDLLGKNVNYNPENESLTITNLPASLLKQLKDELGQL
jgi:nucleoid-associated protein